MDYEKLYQVGPFLQQKYSEKKRCQNNKLRNEEKKSFK